MNEAVVFSKNYTVSFAEYMAGKAVEDVMAKAVMFLGSALCVKGVVPGHIKSMASWGDNYISLSVTDSRKYGVKSSPAWYDGEYRSLEFYINIIVFGFSRRQVEDAFSGSIEQTVFSREKQ